MAKGYRVCRVCGKEYEYCRTNRPAELFRWQDVACCPAHGAEYFASVEAARNGRCETVPQEEDETDLLFEEEFEDSDEEPEIE